MQKLKSFITNKIELVAVVLALLLITVLIGFFDKTVLFVLCFSMFVGFLSYSVYCYVVKFKHFSSLEGDTFKEFSVESLNGLSAPMLIIDSNDEIVWYNDAFESIKKGIGLNNNKSVKDALNGALCYYTLNKIKKSQIISSDDIRFEVDNFGIKLKGGECLLTFWRDVTKQYVAEDTLKKKNLVVGYAAVDNAEDMGSYLPSQYRAAVALAYKTLHEWVIGMNGVIGEYDRNKYIIFVDEENFSPNIGSKFNILDQIASVLTAQEIRLTFSMGFAVLNGSLSEKESGAREALELASQRGGAQVVVKTYEASTSYGGQSKASAKTSKTKSRLMAEKLNSLIDASDHVMIMGHKYIDVDAFAAACAVARFALLKNKKVNIVVDPNSDQVELFMSFLDGLQEYQDNVFIDSKQGLEALNPDVLVVIVDVSNPKVFESEEIYKNATNLAIIDHHRQTTEFEIPFALQYIDPTASSASELMCEMVESVLSRDSGLKTPEKELLLAGILLDTQRFTRHTGVRTFGAMMFLRPDDEMMLRARSVSKPNLDEYIKLSEFQKHAEVYRDIVGLSYFDSDNVYGNKIYASMAAENLLEIEGVKASFALASVGDDVCISARSDGTMNVETLMKNLGGGGRFEAAATTIKSSTVAEAKELLINTIDTIWFEKDTTGGTA